MIARPSGVQSAAEARSSPSQTTLLAGGTVDALAEDLAGAVRRAAGVGDPLAVRRPAGERRTGDEGDPRHALRREVVAPELVVGALARPDVEDERAAVGREARIPEALLRQRQAGRGAVRFDDHHRRLLDQRLGRHVGENPALAAGEVAGAAGGLAADVVEHHPLLAADLGGQRIERQREERPAALHQERPGRREARHPGAVEDRLALAALEVHGVDARVVVEVRAVRDADGEQHPGRAGNRRRPAMAALGPLRVERRQRLRLALRPRALSRRPVLKVCV